MSAEAARLLSVAVVDRRNILVAGGTSSGKTTLANALLAEMAHLDERVILIEDTRELQSPARDTVALRTRPSSSDKNTAVTIGHPGGIATVHANSAASALYRIEQLIQESVVIVPRHLVAEAINIIVFIAGRGTARRIETIACVAGLDPDGGYAVVDLFPDPNHDFEGD